MNRIKHIQKRQRAERRFLWYGRASIVFALAMLCFLLISIVSQGYQGFVQTQIRLTKAENVTAEDSSNSPSAMVQHSLRAAFPDASGRKELRELYGMVSSGATNSVSDALKESPDAQEFWVPASDVIDMYAKGKFSHLSEDSRPVSARQAAWYATLDSQGSVRRIFNTGFLTHGDSREPDQAGVWSSIMGSVFTMLVCIALAFPVGVMTAVYLEEFAPHNKWVDMIEVNINNLAAVPSIVFGLLGLAVYLGVMGMPRSSSVVGGLTLALMVLPIIIITTRIALKAVPDSIRNAARALGASPLQVVMHHVVPLALPGIMTGTILGIARALGETAPLLMIGMVAFVADAPNGFTDPATVMPVQIYLWASNPEAGFVEKTAAGIMVLIVLLVVMNSLALYIRRRFEHRW